MTRPKSEPRVASEAKSESESESESMTGYGESRAKFGTRTIICRARSLNHRFLDVKLRLPRPDLMALDLAIRKRLAELFKRGAIEVTVTVETGHESSETSINVKLAESYTNQAKRLAKKLKLGKTALSLDGLLRLPGVVAANGVADDLFAGTGDAEVIQQLILPALNALKNTRRAEGRKLYQILIGHLNEMGEHVEAIKALEQPEKEKARSQMIERAQETLKLLEGIRGQPISDEFATRLREEAVFWIERRDFAEERSRLELHLTEFRNQLKAESAGRKLEFLQQEILREINTLGTKSQSTSITSHTIELKAILERAREQLANVE